MKTQMLFTMTLLPICAVFNTFAMTEKIDGSPETVQWRMQIMHQQEKQWLQTQEFAIKNQVLAERKMLAEARIAGFKNADTRRQFEATENMVTPISGNDGLSVAAVKWNDAKQTSPVVWLFIFGIVAALALLVGVIMWERRRLRQKLERLKTTRALQLELIQARIMAIKNESSKT